MLSTREARQCIFASLCTVPTGTAASGEHWDAMRWIRGSGTCSLVATDIALHVKGAGTPRGVAADGADALWPDVNEYSRRSKTEVMHG